MAKELIQMNHATILQRGSFKNFSGQAMGLSAEGRRYFTVLIDNMEDAEHLRSLGLNVKQDKYADPEDGPKYFLKMNIIFKDENPTRWTVTEQLNRVVMDEHGKVDSNTQLDSATAGDLDRDDILYADIEFALRPWELKNGLKGVSADVVNMYAVVKLNEFTNRYQVPGDEELPF